MELTNGKRTFTDGPSDNKINHYGTNSEGRAMILKSRSSIFKTQDTKLIASQMLSQERAITDIWRGIDKKSLTSQINSKVVLGLQAYEDDLNIRRKRLKKLLDEEAKSFHELSQNRMQNSEIYYKSQDKIEEVVVLPDKEEDEHLARKKLELDIAKFKELRSIISMRRDTETREMQKLQMKEKKAIQMQEKDINELWHKMMTEDVEKRNALHESEKSDRLQNELKLKNFLSSQMKVSKELKKTEHSIEQGKEQERAIEHNQKLEEAILEGLIRLFKMCT
ncbi:uncharacterized protein LOC143917301 [Arctopsyche grandis]|uniref:uncharacterized protein LOC143917301 n=1 Tax=Arctopsyche grandis TaxID=121162 RepID=UPI00406D825E